jgi:hypothetical protein
MAQAGVTMIAVTSGCDDDHPKAVGKTRKARAKWRNPPIPAHRHRLRGGSKLLNLLCLRVPVGDAVWQWECLMKA